MAFSVRAVRGGQLCLFSPRRVPQTMALSWSPGAHAPNPWPAAGQRCTHETNVQKICRFESDPWDLQLGMVAKSAWHFTALCGCVRMVATDERRRSIRRERTTQALKVEAIMNVCDARGCPTRATRTIHYDNGHSLHACSHHASQWCPWIPAEQRWSPEEIIIFT